jgi:hypothetical protein
MVVVCFNAYLFREVSAFSDHAFGLQTSFVNRPSLWMRNKSPLRLKYSPVKPRAENFNWMGLLETMLAVVGLSDPGKPIMTASYLPS